MYSFCKILHDINFRSLSFAKPERKFAIQNPAQIFHGTIYKAKMQKRPENAFYGCEIERTCFSGSLRSASCTAMLRFFRTLSSHVNSSICCSLRLIGVWVWNTSHLQELLWTKWHFRCFFMNWPLAYCVTGAKMVTTCLMLTWVIGLVPMTGINKKPFLHTNKRHADCKLFRHNCSSLQRLRSQ